MTGHPGSAGELPDFELYHQCTVYRWGIRWTTVRSSMTPPGEQNTPLPEEITNEHHSARWEQIAKIKRRTHSPPMIFGPPGGLVSTSWTTPGSTTYYCDIYLANGLSATFSEDLSLREAHLTRNLSPVPGKTQPLNVMQLARLLKKEVARSRRSS